MALSTPEKLRRFYEQFSMDNQVLVLVNADPDAIASAMAVKRLLWRKVAGITISNVNIIKRPDNLAMVRLLGVNLVRVEDLDDGRFSKVVIVDSQPDHHEAFGRFCIDVIIDHHPDTSPKAAFKDIRPQYGATASIMTEYLRSAKIKPSAKLATGLYHAIKTDTSNFERQTLIEDLRAFQFLFRHANIHLARKIEQAELRLDFLKYFKKALRSMYLCRGRVFVHLGPITNPDICVLVADFFMKVSSVTWSIISGIYDNKLVIILRNDGIRKNAGNTAKASFGHIGSAGGHKSMARAEIQIDNLANLVDTGDEKRVLRWLIRQFEKKVAKK
ncbi:MAG: DHH family phosphoesterase [Deltaproteobacteria bacterium]|nr:DHH family phosphoesterase [Deltaproteobacteria bacterium]MBW1962561.1 DHH family phosphoesterase [Deltaproteobacteria bacterium]MBW2150139.1 DHH family phosphoesterase [Deltaproteobacteria bacterium]